MKIAVRPIQSQNIPLLQTKETYKVFPCHFTLFFSLLPESYNQQLEEIVIYLFIYTPYTSTVPGTQEALVKKEAKMSLSVKHEFPNSTFMIRIAVLHVQTAHFSKSSLWYTM